MTFKGLPAPRRGGGVASDIRVSSIGEGITEIQHYVVARETGLFA